MLTAGGIRSVPVGIVVLAIAHRRLAPAVGIRVKAVGACVPILRGLAVPRGAGGFLPGHGLLAAGPPHALLGLGLSAVGLRGLHLGLLPVLVCFLAPMLDLASACPLDEHREHRDAQQHGETDDDHDCNVHLYDDLLGSARQPYYPKG